VDILLPFESRLAHHSEIPVLNTIDALFQKPSVEGASRLKTGHEQFGDILLTSTVGWAIFIDNYAIQKLNLVCN